MIDPCRTRYIIGSNSIVNCCMLCVYVCTTIGEGRGTRNCVSYILLFGI